MELLCLICRYQYRHWPELLWIELVLLLKVMWCVVRYICDHQWVKNVLRIILVRRCWRASDWRQWGRLVQMSCKLRIFVLHNRVTVVVTRLVVLISSRAYLELLRVLVITLILKLVLHATRLRPRELCWLVMLLVLHHNRSVVWVGST